MNITYNDITTRLYSVKNNRYYGDTIQPRLYTPQGKFCRENALNAIQNWEHLAETTDEAFNKALDVFEEICLNENDSTIRHTASCLTEDIKKVRDASQLQNSIKWRNSHLKSKVLTKINNRRDDVTNALTDALQKIRHTLTANPNTPTEPNPPDRTANNDDEPTAESGVIDDCFNMFFAEATKYKECDRIIANYNKVSNRFNLDRIVLENDLQQALWDFGACMDTYEVPFRKKYSCALESAYYTLAKQHVQVDNATIIEGVTDYFIFSGALKEEQIPDVTKVKNNSVLFEFSDFEALDYLYDDDSSIDQIEVPDAETLTENYGVDFGFLALNETPTKKQQIKNNAKHIKVDLVKSSKKLVKDAKRGNPEEEAEQQLKNDLDDFRKKAVKDPDNKNNLPNFKSMLNTLFTKTPTQVVYELPNLFGIIRVVFVVTATALNPILGLVTFITDQIIRMTLERKQMDRIIDNYKKEIDTVNKKIDKTKDDKTKDNLTKYRDELKKDLDKLNQHADSLYTDDENDERHANDWEDMDFDDDDLDFEWDDAEFDELAKIITVSNMVTSINEALLVDDKDLDGVVFSNVFKLDNDCLDSLTDFSCAVPVILGKDKLCAAFKDYRAQLREGKCTVSDYIRISCLNDNIYKLEHSAPVYNTSNNLDAAIYYLSCLNEFVKLDCDDTYVVEAMSFTNTIKLALDRMKKGISKLSDKEKMASRTIDASASQLSKSMERAMMNDSRESIIKGSVIPSASKCIKTALALGVAWAINPAIAVVAALGKFACQKKMQKKERQLVLDEIDIELKMTERYLHQAEEENDMEKVRQYEMALRSLQRQQQRIKYSMHVYHDNVPAPRESNS